MVSCHSIAEVLFSYETPKIVQIKNILIGVISRIIQLAIIGYIIGYVLVYKKGYQEFSAVESSVTTKVKGVVYTNFSSDSFNDQIQHPEWYRRIWDVADFVVPPSENGATFIATNVIITANQTQGKCAEDFDIEEARCDPDNNTCIPGKTLPTGNGAMTGRCIPFNDESMQHTCEIQAWCPIEDDTFPLEFPGMCKSKVCWQMTNIFNIINCSYLSQTEHYPQTEKNNSALLQASEDFTILIKNFVDFPKFANSNRRNIKDISNSSYLKSCHYDPDHNQECPVFRLGDIVRWSGQADYDSIASQGGVIAIVIKWDCNLDFDKKYCFPKYDFSRLDDPDAKLAPGWNFRYANYYSDTSRTLYKMYGIRLSISVVGQAGKFRVVPLLTNVGAGLGLLAVEVVICDIIVLYMTKRRLYFKSKKYEEVDPDGEAAPIIPEVCISNPESDAKVVDIGDGYQRLED